MKKKYIERYNFKNKRLLLILMALCMVSIAFANKKNGSNDFYISGTAAFEDSTMLILEYMNISGKGFRDTTFLKNEHFSFKGTIIGPTEAWIVCKQRLKKEIENQLFIEPKKMGLSYGFKNDQYVLLVTGSKTNEELEKLKKSQLHFHDELTPLFISRNKFYDSLNKVADNQYLQYKVDSLQKMIDSLSTKRYDLDIAFVTGHPASFLSAYLLLKLSIGTGQYSIESASIFYGHFLPEVKNSYYGKQIANAIATSAGGTAKDFSAQDLNGNIVSLSSFKHKSYVLLDFWASWCKPCRVSNVHLVEVYNKYHLKGLEIVGIAKDDMRVEKWKKAIEEDKTGMFYQILQGAGSKNDIVFLYSVGAIPVKILIDKEGTIVYRSTGDSDELLDKMLAEIFGQ